MDISPIHKYELEIHRIYHDYCYAIKNENLKPDITHSKEYCTNRLKEVFEDYCKAAGLNFYRNTQIIIHPDSHEYFFFLTIDLIFKSPVEIEYFLDYHFDLCEHAEIKTLISFLKYLGITKIYSDSPVDNETRVNEIKKWIKKKEKTLKAAHKNNRSPKKSKTKNKYTSPTLIWNEQELKKLGIISKRLFEKKYTNSPSAFTEVFISNTKSKWCHKNIATLGILLNILRKEKLIKVEGAKNNKAVLDTARLFFIDFSGKVLEKKALINAIYQSKKTPTNLYKVFTDKLSKEILSFL
jgi:hypothetical protein